MGGYTPDQSGPSLSPFVTRAELPDLIAGLADGRFAQLAQLAVSGAPNGIGPAKVGVATSAAPADHVHPFGAALQRSRVPVASGSPNASVVWTFSTPFVDGSGSPVVPIIGCLVESPSSTTLFQEPQITSIDNTQVTLLLRAQASTVNLTGLLTLALGGANIPANTYLHLSARNPSA